MSHQYDFITDLLDLKDPNIKFFDDFYSEEVIHGIQSKVFHGTLTYQPHACYQCGTLFDEEITKHGFKVSTIKLVHISGFPSYLRLKKQRYYCKHCASTFTLSTRVVDKHCHISKNIKLSIALKAKDKLSEKDIAKEHNVSHSTVNRLVNSFYEHHKPNYHHLPKHLCFDEFKSVKSTAGAMSFIFCDGENGKILDILEDRRLPALINYFLKYKKSARNNVETIVIDMYSPYISLIKKLFPKAKIIIDRFHIVQLFNRSFNKTRVQVMNSSKKDYNKFKKYWKLLLMDPAKLTDQTFRYCRSFKKPMRPMDIVDALLDLSPELKASYDLYHGVRIAIKNQDFHQLQLICQKHKSTVSTYMKTSIRTLEKYADYVQNTLEYAYTNGILEGLNNKIKVIKRIAFGFRCFFHLKNRIMITQNLANLKTA